MHRHRQDANAECIACPSYDLKIRIVVRIWCRLGLCWQVVEIVCPIIQILEMHQFSTYDGEVGLCIALLHRTAQLRSMGTIEL